MKGGKLATLLMLLIKRITMRICIVSSIGKQTYQGKYLEKKGIWSDFWNLALFHEGMPIDIVDYYQLISEGRIQINSDRHIYTNGIVLANRLSNDNSVCIWNSLPDSYDIENIDVLLISTNYITGNWIFYLKDLLIKCNKLGIKCVIGGIGIKKLYLNDNLQFQEISNLVDGFIVIADGGLKATKWAVEHIYDRIPDKIIIGENDYDFMHTDYSMKKIDVSLHSQHTVLLTQNGCIYNCAFCSYKDRNGEHTFFDLDEVKQALLEIVRTNKKGIRHIRFADETFNLNNHRIIELCNFITEQKFEFTWSCFLRANNITKELIDALAKSKCDFVSIGIESGSRKMQKIMNKNIDLDQLKNSISLIKEAGIVVNVSLLVGFLGEDDRTIQDTIDYIRDCKPTLARINLWYPARGENNKELFQEYGFIVDKDTWRHDTMSEQEAVIAAKKLYLMDSDTIVIPPFSSIFDQWPVLSSKGLKADRIVNILRSYYTNAKKKYLLEN